LILFANQFARARSWLGGRQIDSERL